MSGTNEENYEFLPLRESVFLKLRSQILKGELKPGERLMEITLANRLGASRTPVREAIRMLEREGLVVMRPRRGAQVAKVTEQELNDVLEVRKGLEILAITKACERMTPKDFEAMQKAAEAFSELAEDPASDLTELAEADVLFHDNIYQGAKNRRLLQILSNLREQMYRFRVEYLKGAVRSELVREHKKVMEAVRARDKEAAVKLISEHVDNQQRAIVAAIREAEAEGE